MDKVFYLDERIIVPIEVQLSETGVYMYHVFDRDTNQILFIGNTFIEGMQQYVNIDVTDIIRGQLTTPSFFENLPQQEFETSTTYQPIYKKFEIIISDSENTGGYSSGDFYVNMYYRYPLIKEELNNGLVYNPTAVNTLWISLQGRYNVNGKGYFKLPPRVPYIYTNNYCLAFAGYVTDGLLNRNDTYIYTYGFNDIDTNSTKKYNVRLIKNNYCSTIALSSLFDDTTPINGYSDFSIWFQSDEVAKIDICPAKYYLMWQDRAGSFQSQPFDKVSTYSESFNREYITNYKGVKRPTTITTSPKIRVQTGYIDEKLYPYYESIFTSPYLLLYDTKEDKSYLVNVTGDYTEKTFKNQSRQMFNIQLDLEFAKNQNMIY